ncbi:MAG: L-2-amino-thiazoline-4-carboxylic acid hydrolase [Vicinamibacteria bacterium]|nr:L-2-amino-thiazoline-4-carboxylic acid hydrolase [Vicinamibacteria bacterium]
MKARVPCRLCRRSPSRTAIFTDDSTRRRTFLEQALALAGTGLLGHAARLADAASLDSSGKDASAKEDEKPTHDEIPAYFGWITELLERPVSDCFDAESPEHAVLTRLKEGWGKRDTAELLRGLTAQYGEVAGKAVDKFLELNIRKNWAEIGKRQAHDGTEIEDFIRVLWEPLKEHGFKFTIRRDDGTAAFRVTKCPIHDLAERTGMHDWLYRLACATDYYTTPAFSPKIIFTRTKTLMQGHDCCDHKYVRKHAPGEE